MRKQFLFIGMPLFVASVILAACATTSQLPPSAIAPICKAMIGPIKYNSLDSKSKRFAAALLAMDLKQRNQVGRNLGCPLYK
jgi:hypothetical protein